MIDFPPLTVRAVIPCLLLLLTGCGSTEAPPETSQAPVRLVDSFDPATAPPAPTSSIEPTSWSFADGNAAGWQPGPDVEGFEVRDGMLVGRTTGERSVLHAEVDRRVEGDTIWAVELRMRVSAGENFYVRFVGDEGIDLDQQAAMPTDFVWRMGGLSSPLAGDEMRTFTLRPSSTFPSELVRHVLIRPSDSAGADFAIESLRVIFRHEHLAEIPAGVGWHGLAEIYRETLVAHAPETLEIEIDVPARPLLDLGIGSPEASTVGFRVDIVEGSEVATVLQEQAPDDATWSDHAVALDSYAGRRVTLRLSLESEQAGAVGFWGSPAVRSRAATDEATDRPRSVLVILTDTVRADSLEMHGYERETAPTLSRLGAGGARFTHAQSDTTWTKASVPSILTSLYTTSHGVDRFDDRLPAAAQTLAEHYREAGYTTLSLSSVFFTGRMSNLHQGFEIVHEAASLPPGSKTASAYVDRLLAWLEERSDVPVFVLLHLYDAHYPYQPATPSDAKWADPELADQVKAWQHASRAHIDDPLLGAVGMPTRDQLTAAGADADAFAQQWKDWYDGSILAMDSELGRLMASLDAWGLTDRMAISVVSDHGEEFLEHDRTFHGQGVYAELTRVPLTVRFPPRLPAGTVVDSAVTTLDLMPTLLELSGLPIPDNLQGRSLLPLVDGTAEANRRPVFSMKLAVDDALTPPPRDLEAFSVLLDGWKLIHYTARSDGGPEFELFRFQDDPFDQDDLAAENPEVVARLAKVIAGWRQSTEAAALASDADAAAQLSDEELERLRSLGYLQ